MTTTCVRCKTAHHHPEDRKPTHCRWCAVDLSRPVRRIRRRNIGGKRGRNSGKTRSSKNK